MRSRTTESPWEEVATAVVLAERSDRDSLILLRGAVEQLTASIAPDDRRRCEQLERCSLLLGRIIDGGSDDPDADLREAIEEIDVLKKQTSDHEPSRPQGGGDDDVIDRALFQEFLAAQKLAVVELETDILSLERDDGAREHLKRRIHNLKGESGLLGLSALEQLCHGMEELLLAPLSPVETVDLLLRAKDWIEGALDAYQEGSCPEPPDAELMARLGSPRTRATSIGCSVEPREQSATSPDAGTGSSLQTGQADTPREAAVRVARDADEVELFSEFLEEGRDGLERADQILVGIEYEGADPEKVNSLFRVFHTIKGVAGFLGLTDITELAHTTETMLNQVRQDELQLKDTVLDLIFDSTALMRRLLTEVQGAVQREEEVESNHEVPDLIARIEAVNSGEVPEPQMLPEALPGQKLGELLSIPPASVSPSVIQAALQAQQSTGKPLGEQLIAMGEVEPKHVAQALRAQTKAGGGAKIRETIKVDLQRVDSLVEMIGELVIVESMLVNAPEIIERTTPNIRNYLGQLAKITRDLQDVGMRMRMVPLRSVFQKMARMVRDLARKRNKDVKLIQSGEGTEMDRSMVEHIGDPLVHMIRNAVDHGVETAEERIAAGKPPTATIMLSAYHEGGSIVIELSDDGKGLDREAILSKAIAKGLVTEGQSLSETEILNLIFAPGFSTAREVTELSGRGVGMDVVKRNIESLRGRISITTAPGHGTSFKLVLPLTLAIIDGMLVACGEESFIIPTLSIVESIQPDRSTVLTYGGSREVISLRGEIFPMLRLSRLFAIEGARTDPTEALVVVLEASGSRFGLLVDEVVTQQQVVIKNLGSGLGETVQSFSGAAIMADGRVGLILNVDEISSQLRARDPDHGCFSRAERPDREGRRTAMGSHGM